MKVGSATLQRYRLALRQPLPTARGTIRLREGLIVSLVDEHGNVGMGEAAPLPAPSGETSGETSRETSSETLTDAEHTLRQALAPGGPVAGQRVDTPDDIAQLLQSIARLDQLPSAAHALDQALLQLLALRQRLPVWRLLAAPDHRRGEIPVHALVTTAADAEAAVSAGYAWLKLKVGAETIDRDEQRLRQIRSAAGESTALRLDANGCWETADDALTALDRLSRHDVHSVEQPVAPGDIESLARVRASCPVRVAADESIRSMADLEVIVAWHAADAIVIKPMLCGGLLAATRLGRAAAAAGLPVSVTTSLESGVGRHGALHVAAALPGRLWSCGLCTGDLLAQDLLMGPYAQRGTMVPATRHDTRRELARGPVGADCLLDVVT